MSQATARGTQRTRVATAPLLGLCILLAIGGCARGEWFTVHVRDAQTREPIEGARVHAGNAVVLTPRIFNPAPRDEAVTDSQGQASLFVTAYRDRGLSIHIYDIEDIPHIDLLRHAPHPAILPVGSPACWTTLIRLDTRADAVDVRLTAGKIEDDD